MKYNKRFLIIGNQNAITYKEIFPLIKENKIWLGCTMNGSNRWFRVPDSYEMTSAVKIGDGNDGFDKGVKYCFVKAVVWFTNLDCQKRHEEFIPRNYRNYSENEYQKYDNYDAINIDNVNDIPIDYYGLMGVPITFLHKYNPEQFEIISASDFAQDDIKDWKCVTQEFYDLYYAQGNKGQISVGWPLPHFVTKSGKAVIPYKRLFIRRKKGSFDGN